MGSNLSLLSPPTPEEIGDMAEPKIENALGLLHLVPAGGMQAFREHVKGIRLDMENAPEYFAEEISILKRLEEYGYGATGKTVVELYRGLVELTTWFLLTWRKNHIPGRLRKWEGHYKELVLNQLAFHNIIDREELEQLWGALEQQRNETTTT